MSGRRDLRAEKRASPRRFLTSRTFPAGATLLLVGTLLISLAAGGPATGAGPSHPTASAAVDPIVAPLAASPDWPTFHGSENRSGFSPALGPGTPNELWATPVSSVAIRSGPIVRGSEVFVADGLAHVYALNRTNGTVLWNVSVAGQPTQLDVAGGLLLVGTASGGLTALDPGSGRTVWSLPLGSAPVQSPAVANGSVFVGTVGGELAAFALATGVSEWRALFSSPIAGAPALENGFVYDATVNGTLFALSAANGRSVWTVPLNASVATAPAVFGSTVVVGDLDGRVSALSAATGALLWRWPTSPPSFVDTIHATPAVGLGSVFVQRDSGSIVALSLANGSLLWQSQTSYSPVPYVLAPALARNGLYSVIEGIQSIQDFDPVTGAVLWTLEEPNEAPLFTSPALAGGVLYFGADDGFVFAFGSSRTVEYPVRGVVTDSAGLPLSGVAVGISGLSTSLTNASGAFALSAPNGTYVLELIRPFYNVLTEPLVVQGPVPPLRFVLTPLTVFPVTGTVENLYSGGGVARTELAFTGPFGFNTSAVSARNGSFEVFLPNGTITVQVQPPTGFGAQTFTLVVAGGPLRAVALGVTPTGTALPELDPGYLVISLALAGMVGAVAFAGAQAATLARVRRGLPPQLLSPFGRFVLMRALLIPAQLALLFFVLYTFLDVVPSIAAHAPISPLGFFEGYGNFFVPIFTGNWGIITLGKIRAPVTQFLAAYLPPSIELAVFALAISLALAYPLGLLAGWRQGGALDPAARAGSLLGLLVPTFVVAFTVLFFAYESFFRAVGDVPLGTIPTDTWFLTHGGLPPWLTVLGTTQPTGFPLVDGAIHGDSAFEWVVLLKTLLQAAIIALVYVTIFLRYARTLVAEAAQEVHVTAARARGVPERTILWRHTARRVWPLYLLVFGLTIPIYVGTQAVIEIVFTDTGVGSILLAGAVNLAANDVFTRVLILFLAIVILLLTLFADVLARYLDPRARSETP